MNVLDKISLICIIIYKILNLINTYFNYGSYYDIRFSYLFYVTDNKQIKEILYNYAFINTAHFFRLEWMLKALNEDSSKNEKVKKGFSTFLNVILLKYL